MEIMGKCPFFNEPCLKEGCSAFQYIEHCLWEYEEDPRYKAFKKERKPHITEHNEWFAVGIPYCRVLDKELPMKIKEK